MKKIRAMLAALALILVAYPSFTTANVEVLEFDDVVHRDSLADRADRAAPGG